MFRKLWRKLFKKTFEYVSYPTTYVPCGLDDASDVKVVIVKGTMYIIGYDDSTMTRYHETISRSIGMIALTQLGLEYQDFSIIQPHDVCDNLGRINTALGIIR